MRLLVLGVLFVACGVFAGSLLSRGSDRVGRDEVLTRGAQAARAASGVLDGVRWREDGITLSRVLCDNRARDRWGCRVLFRGGDGKELSGHGAPDVAVVFRGRGDRATLTRCVLRDPQMGTVVDCGGRASAAMRLTR